MKVLITGGSGFIAEALCDVLRREGVVFCCLDVKAPRRDSDANSFRQVDIRDHAALRFAMQEFRPSHVVHLAAKVDLLGRSLADYDTNTDGVRSLCLAVSECTSVKRVIYTSSQLVCRPGYVPKSDIEYAPHTLYGESKVLTEKIVRAENGGGVEWCLVRPTTVWGPGMGPHYQSFLAQIVRGRYFHVGHGRLHKSYAYVGNIAYQYWKFLGAPAETINRRTFYLADYEPLSLREYANRLQVAMGARRIPSIPKVCAWSMAAIGTIVANTVWPNFPFTLFRLRNILTEYVFDLSATRDVCGPLPYTFEEGVKATASWYLAEIDERHKKASGVPA
jgi:nucleoside-diphosphate-sugar epimerase